MTPLEILLSARERLAEPERWTQYHYAEDRNGRRVGPVDRDAVCWCLLGALIAASIGSVEADTAAVLVKRTAGVDGLLSIWNDAPERTHAEVLAVLDKAIQLAKENQ